MKFKKYILMLLCLLPVYSFAQTSSISITSASSTSASAPDGGVPADGTIAIKPLQNKKFAEDVNITAQKLRAESGSLSRYSIKTSMLYLGAGVGRLDSRDRPNPDHLVGSFATSLGGSISARYRFDSDSALSFGTGINALHPMHGMDRLDTRTPFLGYDLTKRFGTFQTRQSWEISKTTVPEQLRVGQIGGFTYGTTVIRDIGTSRMSLGLDSRLSCFAFERSYDAPKGRRHPGDGNASNYSLSLTPNLSYNFSDKFSANTALPLSYQNLRASENIWKLRNLTLMQSMGMSYSFTRDVMLSPFINFYPGKMAGETTTFNIATVFSIL